MSAPRWIVLCATALLVAFAGAWVAPSAHAASAPSAPAAPGPAAPAAPTSSTAGRPQDVGSAVQQAIASMGLKKATFGVSVRDLSTGAVTVDVAGWQPLLPASNMKMLTTGAALHVLGADFAFETRLLRDGDKLTVKGDGDPSFGDPAMLAQLV